MSSTSTISISPQLLKMMSNRLSMTLRRIKNHYVSLMISKKRAKEMGVEEINAHFVRCQQIVRDNLRYRFRVVREPTTKQKKELDVLRVEAIEAWRSVMNDLG